MHKKLYIAVLFTLICVLLTSGVIVYRGYMKDIKYTNEFEKLSNSVKRAQAEEPDISKELPRVDTILAEYAELYAANSDMVGWISIMGTTVNYPVMQKPDDPNYYLEHNFDKQYSDYGVPFAAGGCDVFLPSDNIIIHGHHMKNGNIFGALEAYKDKNFYEEHKIIQFDTIMERSQYEITAVFRTAVYSGFPYYEFINASDADEFNAYVSTCKELSLYDTGVTAQYGDKLITLSTCEYSIADGRLVVVARKLMP